MSWNLRQINLNPPDTTVGSVGPAAADDPYVSVYNQQQHFAYRDENGAIQDAWYDGPNDRWNLQQLNLGSGQFSGPVATVGPSVGVYNQQQHFVYTNGTDPSGFGVIQDVWYDGPSSQWNLQQINAGGLGAAFYAIDPLGLELQGPKFRVSVWTYGQQQHFTYFTSSNPRVGEVVDYWWDGEARTWSWQKINSADIALGGPQYPGNTGGPAAVGDPFASVFVPQGGDGQQHIGYRDSNGAIWDAWYDPPPVNSWKLQKVNLGGCTNGPFAFRGPFIWTFGRAPEDLLIDEQLHFTYLDLDGSIQDAWYNGPNNTWNLQQINLKQQNPDAMTYGPAADLQGSGLVPVLPFACVFQYLKENIVYQEQHIAYRDNTGAIWDAWYDGANWNLQQINLNPPGTTDGTDGPAAIGDPFVWVWQFLDNDGSGGGTLVQEVHFTYRDSSGTLWDAVCSRNTQVPDVLVQGRA